MQERVVYDQLTPCPYLPGEIARMPLRLPSHLPGRDFDDRMAAGDRRMGRFLYRTQCPACNACEPIRVRVADFKPARTLAKTLRKGNELLSVRIGKPAGDESRVELYNIHKQARGLSREDHPIDAEGYHQFLVDTCAQTLEFSYWQADKLVAVGISDLGETSLNAVYCFFDPAFDLLSLGNYNVLKQWEACRTWQLDYLYLGLFIAASPHMNYKARYLPHERLIDGSWQRFDRTTTTIDPQA